MELKALVPHSKLDIRFSILVFWTSVQKNQVRERETHRINFYISVHRESKFYNLLEYARSEHSNDLVILYTKA